MRPLLHVACFGALALTTLAFVPQQQPPRPRDPDEGKPTPSVHELRSIEGKLAKMQGLWRIDELKTPRVDAARRLETGYVLVSGLTFSLEIHLGFVAPDGKNVINKDFQSGMHRFELDDAGAMETRTVIGSFFNEQGLLQFEQPQKLRRYDVKFGDEEMIWSNADGTRFVLKHMPEPKYARRDVFGKPIPEKKDERAPKEPPK